MPRHAFMESRSLEPSFPLQITTRIPRCQAKLGPSQVGAHRAQRCADGRASGLLGLARAGFTSCRTRNEDPSLARGRHFRAMKHEVGFCLGRHCCRSWRLGSRGGSLPASRPFAGSTGGSMRGAQHGRPGLVPARDPARSSRAVA